jgi:rRNA maturation RNase YbeY
LFRLEQTPISRVDFIFCDDEYLLKINKEWLNHDYFTDTVSFLLSEPGASVIGEVYISIDRVRENALAFGVPLAEELHRVIFHSCLHLCGYEDKNSALKAKMRIKEDKYLKSYSNM